MQYVTSEFVDETFDDSAVSAWTLTGFTDAKTSKCGTSSLVGGYKVAGLSKISRDFKLDFVPSSLYVTFDLYFIDDW